MIICLVKCGKSNIFMREVILLCFYVGFLTKFAAC